jgi:hypothetical protein
MSFIIENTAPSGDFKQVPAGLHLARCYRIVDIGTQRTEYDGVEKLQRRVSLFWELHGKDDNGESLVTERGEPLGIFKNYTQSWHEKASLRIDLQSWRNKPFTESEMKKFDISNILGSWCMVTVIQRPGKNGKMYSNVGGISPVPSIIKQAGLPDGVNPLKEFDLKNPDYELFDTFGKGLKERIEASPEWKALQGKKPAQNASKAPSSGFDDMEDDLPF